VPEKKYQSEGGPSLKQCFALIREYSTIPAIDLSSFLDVVIFNFLIGNHDAHGKNFSFLYRQDKTQAAVYRALAPFYDLLSTLFYPELSRKMAMRLGGEYDSTKIRLSHFEKLAEEAQLSKPMVLERVRELTDILISQLEKLPQEKRETIRSLFELILERCQKNAKLFNSK
jgi:serine/threonine-protein kinase HipA